MRVEYSDDNVNNCSLIVCRLIRNSLSVHSLLTLSDSTTYNSNFIKNQSQGRDRNTFLPVSTPKTVEISFRSFSITRFNDFDQLENLKLKILIIVMSFKHDQLKFRR